MHPPMEKWKGCLKKPVDMIYIGGMDCLMHCNDKT